MQEQELKLTAADAPTLYRVRDCALVGKHRANPAPPRADYYAARYYDSAEGHLARMGATLRIRREAGVWVAALKLPGRREGGLVSRPEWEAPASGWIEHSGQLPAGEIAERLLTAMPESTPLVTRVAVQMWRAVCPLEAEGSRIELCLDEALITANRRAHMLYEVELELKAGDLGALLELGGQLQGEFNLTPSRRGKYATGLALYQTDAD